MAFTDGYLRRCALQFNNIIIVEQRGRGNGGNVTVVYGSPLKRAIAVIRNALNNLDGQNARIILSALKSLPDQGMKLPSGQTLGMLLSEGDQFVQAMKDLFLSTPKNQLDNRSSEYMKKLKLITDTLAVCIDTLNTHITRIETDIIYPKILNKAGETGNYGSGPKGTRMGEKLLISEA